MKIWTFFHLNLLGFIIILNGSDVMFMYFLDRGAIFIILAADHNIFKLQLNNEYGFKVHTLKFNLMVFTSFQGALL